MLGIPWYLVPIVGYLLLYAGLYFGPLLWRVTISAPGDAVETLERRIQKEVRKEKKRRAAPNGTTKEEAGMASDESPGDESLNEEAPNEEASYAEGRAFSEADDDRPPSAKDDPTERSLLSRTLESSFSSRIVQQAVEQLRTKYPHADFRRFELERLPAYAAYDERLTAARNMAGLFVLFGLLGTMIKLNSIVRQIGASAAKNQVAADVFLSDMGNIMADIGGAFDSSIWGLAAMILFLVAIGVLDRWMQKTFDTLDRTIQLEVVPGLSKLQLMQAPNLSIGDLIDETSGLLNKLNHSVEGMTEGMNASLGELATEINKMMQDFGSFQNQYAQLNDLITYLKEYTESVDNATSAIKGASHTLANPISQMNHDLNETIREHMGVVGESITASANDRDALIKSFRAVENDLKRQTEEIRTLARASFDAMEGQQSRNEEILEKEIELLAEQSDAVQAELRAVAEALQMANSEQLAEIIAQLKERVDASSDTLASSAGALSSSATDISQSAQELRRASNGMKISKTSPNSAFEWIYRAVQEARNGSN
ncbi:MotA/TolQ/ExbB proton channel family protein [Salisaeta longa]|uniref:MotA/TolQ/ExbB proton channel family protein n=1 Tax=Salisaeta longa TaxID=503170 RepID=UPI00058CE59D|nr:MotA/TolQ/ExbB proton channel family protein [Salisaeta longa]